MACEHDPSTTEIDLREEVKAQLRVEEVYREEFRRELRGRFWWINKPIVIWFLTTIIVGLISFAYSQYNERATRDQLNHQKAIDISLEVRFRIRQVDEVLSESLEARDDILGLFDNDELIVIAADGRLSDSGEKLKRLYQAAPRLTVIAKLGGIGSVPRTDQDAIVWIGGTGWRNSALPIGRGFQSDEFRYLSLHNLWENYRVLTKKNEEVSEDRRIIFSRFDNATEPNSTISDLPRISSNANTMRVWSESIDLQSIKITTENVGHWIDEIHTAWNSLKDRLAADNVGEF